MSKIINIIIGSTGIVGSELFDKLKKKKLITISRSKSNFKNHNVGNIENINFLKKIKKKFNLNNKKITIFYCSGMSRVKYNQKIFYDILQKSILQLNNVLKIFNGQKVKIIYCSSGSVYSSEIKKPNEKSIVQSKNLYTTVKLLEEQLIMNSQKLFKTKYIIARIFSIYSKKIKKFFIYDAYKKIKLCKKIVLHGSGNQCRDYLLLEDVAKGLILLSQKGVNKEIYNICSGKCFKLDKMAKYLNKKITNNKKKNYME